MEVVNLVSRFSLGKADILRKTIGKGKVKEIETYKIEFIDEAAKNGYSKGKASDIFDNLESARNHMFSKTHAVAYTIIAYRMAFLKAHYPEEFEQTI